MMQMNLATIALYSTLLYFTLIFCLKSYSELKSGETRQISIRDGTEFHESLEVRRLWRDNRFDPNSKEKYFDIAILELGKDYILSLLVKVHIF